MKRSDSTTAIQESSVLLASSLSKDEITDRLQKYSATECKSIIANDELFDSETRKERLIFTGEKKYCG